MSNIALRAYTAAKRIIDDLSDRSGIGDELDCCDAEVLAEIEAAIHNIIVDEFKKDETT